MYADYLVLTGLLDEKALTRKLDWLGVKSEAELQKLQRFAVFGYKGFKRDKLFVGENNERYMFIATGSIANDKIKSKAIENLASRSVARLDLQVTIPVPNADNIVNFAVPAKLYKAMKITSINATGMTLYVGSAKSDLRLRIYNKTAESGIKSDTGLELVRFELQLRNSYADSALVAVRGGGAGLHFLTILHKMVDKGTYQFVEQHVQRFENELFPEPYLLEDTESKDVKTKRWLERCVLPSLRRLAVTEHEYVIEFLESVYRAIEPDVDDMVRF